MISLYSLHIEINRINFRQRQVDYSKQLQIITDVNEVAKKDDYMNLFFTIPNGSEDKKDTKIILDYEIKKVIDLFDKKNTTINKT